MKEIPCYGEPSQQHQIVLIQVPIPRRHGKHQRHPRGRLMRTDVCQEATVASPGDPLYHAVELCYEGPVGLALQLQVVLLEFCEFFCRRLEHILGESVLLCVIGHLPSNCKRFIGCKSFSHTGNMLWMLFQPTEAANICRFDLMTGEHLVDCR